MKYVNEVIKSTMGGQRPGMNSLFSPLLPAWDRAGVYVNKFMAVVQIK
jgi:hypothetical protein